MGAHIIIPVPARGGETDPWSLLTSQSSQIDKPQVQWEILSKKKNMLEVNIDIQSQLQASTHVNMHLHMCVHRYTNKYTVHKTNKTSKNEKMY